MLIQPEVDAAAIVLIGSFNPRIFRPDWFKATEIIGESDADAASIRIIHEALASFSLDWATISVDQSRFAIEATRPPHVLIQDLVLKTFNEFLTHTPIHQLGLNRSVHFNVGDFAIRDKIGKMLAPQGPWGEWSPYISGKSTDLRLHGGMKSLVMMQADRGDGYEGSINAKVEPSARPTLQMTGIFMEINDHYVVGKPDDVIGSENAMAIVQNQWTTSMTRSEWIINQVMALKDRSP